MHDAELARLPEALPAASLSSAERVLPLCGTVHVCAGVQLCGQAAGLALLGPVAALHAALVALRMQPALHMQPAFGHDTPALSAGDGAGKIQWDDEVFVVRHVT